jgi:hypothetical protein
MKTFHFPAGDLIIDHGHTRLAFRDLQLHISERPREEVGSLSSDFINGRWQVEGQLSIDSPASQGRLRPGMQGLLRLVAPDGRHTRMPLLLTEMKSITNSPAGPGMRTYCWAFLVLARPAVDAHRLFPAPLQDLPEGEITVEELVTLLGGDADDPGRTSVRINSEGGFQI